MPNDLKEKIEAAKCTRDALWNQLNEIEEFLTPKLASFLDMIGLRTITPSVCNCEGNQRCMDLIWLLDDEVGVVEAVEFELHRGNLLTVLLEEPEEFDSILDVSYLKETVRFAAEKLSLDLGLVESFLSEQGLMISLADGKAELTEMAV